MFVVHHLENSRSHRVLWALEEVGAAYEIKTYKRNPKTMYAPRELREVHPLGLSPVVEHRTDAGETVIVAESGAILEYLADLYPQLRPTEPTALREARYWLHFAEATMMPALLMALVFRRIAGPAVPFFVRPITKVIQSQVMKSFIRPRLTRQLDMIEAHLAGRDWLAGDAFSLADLQMGYPLLAAGSRGGHGDRPHIKRYLAALQARPAWQAADREGGALVF